MLEAFLNYEIYNNKKYFIAYGLQTFSVWNNYLDFSLIFFCIGSFVWFESLRFVNSHLDFTSLELIVDIYVIKSN